MTQRRWLLAAMLLAFSVTFASPGEAQRSGFIIGFGLGPGLASTSLTVPGFGTSDRESETGVATDFHIGGVVGESLELYYVNKIIFHGDDVADIIATGMSGIGVTYPLSPEFYVNGAIGIWVWTEIDSDATNTESYTGLGLLAGGGYRLNQRWALDFDVMYGKPGDDTFNLNVLGAKLTINILSH